jgi:glycosyltransferase involved in cell wall biosynthesis
LRFKKGRQLNILWFDAFHGGSHAAVSQGFQHYSRHRVELLTLPINGGWRWRMRGAAVTFARLSRSLTKRPDLIVVTDMLDLATFRALSADVLGGIPTALYFHENQLTYPLPAGRSQDLSFAWTNYTSALSADALLFNSDFHRRSFIDALPGLLGRFHDYQEIDSIVRIAAKAQVLPPGVDLRFFDAFSRPPHDGGPPILLWNSRWEYDKQPDLFFNALNELDARGIDFRLIVAGEHIDPNAADFVAARERWADRIVHWGYVPDRARYGELLQRADIVVSTAIQEFFGIGVVEALYCGCIPLLPRRLSYPDLLPEAYYRDCLYSSDAGLVERLASVIARRAELVQHDWRSVAAGYDWEVMAERYDRVLSGVRSQESEVRT